MQIKINYKNKMYGSLAGTPTTGRASLKELEQFFKDNIYILSSPITINNMQKIIKENIIKNFILIVLLLFLFFPIQCYLANSGLINDKVSSGNVLVAASIIVVTACFGNFAFTYEKIDTRSIFQRYLAHFTTGLLMLVIGISLILTDILISFIMGRFFLIDITLFLLYTACIGHDLWDILRIR